MSDTAREAVTDSMVKAAIDRFASPADETWHEAMRAVLEAALESQQPAPEEVREEIVKVLMSDRVAFTDAMGRDYAYVEADAILAVFDVRRKP